MVFIGLNDGGNSMIDIDKIDVITMNDATNTLVMKSQTSVTPYEVNYENKDSMTNDFHELRINRDFIRIVNVLVRLDSIEAFAKNQEGLCIITRGGYLLEIEMSENNKEAYYEEIKHQLILM